MSDDTTPAAPRSGSGNSSSWIAGIFQAFIAKFNRWFGTMVDVPIPPELLVDPEQARRARLVTRFGVLGSLFGISYAIFYLFIEHHWGAVIVLICSSGVAITPFMMRWKKSVELGGNFLSFTLTL